MTGLLQTRVPPVTPVYSQPNPGAAISLGNVDVSFEVKGEAKTSTADAVMRFVPASRLEFLYKVHDESPFFGLRFMIDVGRDVQLRLTGRGVTVSAFCVGAGDDGVVFVPTSSPVTITPPSADLSSAKFHLFNFPNFIGPDDYLLMEGETIEQGGRRCGRVVLEANGWRIVIAATGETDGLSKSLESLGGFVITHAAEVLRQDGSDFSSDQLEDLLQCLHYFLSFALGRWAGVALPVGFDREGKQVFEQWGLGIAADRAWNGTTAWFDEHHSELLSHVFPGFMSLWTNPLWKRPIRHALYWYLGACDRRVGVGVDTGVILSQASLEVLAWTRCVLDRKIAKASQFGPRGLTAAQKLRLLLSDVKISTAIPTGFDALQQPAGGQNRDAVDAIVTVRNSLVHPDNLSVLPENAYAECWQLSLWYVDLVLLSLCGHAGAYANRLKMDRWVGQVERVPWAV